MSWCVLSVIASAWIMCVGSHGRPPSVEKALGGMDEGAFSSHGALDRLRCSQFD